MQTIFFTKSQEGQRIGNIFCIGRNYAAHIAELGNKQSETPLVFLKPTSALNTRELIHLPNFSNEIDYETELVLYLGRKAKDIDVKDAWACIAGYGVGLDLTARDLQTVAKKQGLPWTVAKGFDNSASVSAFVSAEEIAEPQKLSFQMKQNGILRQHGQISMMLFDIPYLVAYLSSIFTLQPGDLIFTGTPEGTGRINKGDQIEVMLDGKLQANFLVAS